MREQLLTEKESQAIERFVRKFDRDFRRDAGWFLSHFIIDSADRWSRGKETYPSNLLVRLIPRDQPSLKRRLEIFSEVVLFVARFEKDWKRRRAR